jgi:hypothetical protein
VRRASATGHSDPMQQEASPPAQPGDSVDALRLVVQARDAEIHMLKLLVQKLKL